MAESCNILPKIVHYIAYFDVSQGYDQNIESRLLLDRLTRLYVNTGFSIGKIAFSTQEFYFHRTSEHKIISTASYNFSRAKISGNFSYNSFNSLSTPVEKLAGYTLSLNPNDLITLNHFINYDIRQKLITQSGYSLLYSPLNNCWKIELSFAQDQIDKKFGMLFYINYNENNFTSINVR